MEVKRQIFFFFATIALCILYVKCLKLQELVSIDERFEKTWEFAKKSEILNDFNKNDLVAGLTLFIPSNDAWDGLSPKRKKYLLNKENREDLEMLMLYCGSDTRYTRDDFFENGGRITTFVGAPVYVAARENKVCLLKDENNSSNTRENFFACAKIGEWDIEAEDGIIHIINKIIIPDELETKFREKGI